MDAILEIAKKHNLFLIEDAAEAHGASYKSKRAGNFGHISCFSFYANKIITTGEGGMILTDDEKLAERCTSYRNLCFREDKRFYHTELGANYRMTNMQAAIGVAQINRIDGIIDKKKGIGTAYTKSLQSINAIQLQKIHSWIDSTYWMFPVLIKSDYEDDGEILGKKLLAKGIQTRPFFLGMHKQPAFIKSGLFIDELYPVADELYSKGLYLPSGLSLTRRQIEFILTCMYDIFDE